ncbi:MAG: DegV family protein [Acutalibacteraceae bacterium]|nr:DegV family protein [Acutalibacteraceae bacterium]
MQNYILFTDSGCDIPLDTLNDWGVKSIPLSFKFKDSDKEYKNGDIESKEFYDRMREGAVATTSAINMETFKDAFREVLKEGQDVLYLGFSSGLSTTYNSARMAAEELKEEFPDRKILAVDTLCASAGQGLLVYLTVEKIKSGATIEEAAAYAEDTKKGLCHWFTVDDLVYLKRGGRVSPTVAFVGGLLGIKPILHVDDEGHLINMGKVRGRTAALTALADKIGENAGGKPNSPIYICHADCMNDVETLKGMIKDKYNLPIDMVVDIGAVIGAHAGPGTIAVFFTGKER